MLLNPQPGRFLTTPTGFPVGDPGPSRFRSGVAMQTCWDFEPSPAPGVVQLVGFLGQLNAQTIGMPTLSYGLCTKGYFCVAVKAGLMVYSRWS